MAQQTTADDDSTELTIERIREVELTETLTVTHKRGDGTRDTNKVRNEVSATAVVSVEDGLGAGDVVLLSEDRQDRAVADTKARMDDLRAHQPDADDDAE